jgi:hypothetical protein
MVAKAAAAIPPPLNGYTVVGATFTNLNGRQASG